MKLRNLSPADWFALLSPAVTILVAWVSVALTGVGA